jgi:hypothetical protein
LSKHRLAGILLAGIAALVLASSWPAYAHRHDRPVLFYYGAAPEAPSETAFVVLNPFRDRQG